jgi:hypothetical protein
VGNESSANGSNKNMIKKSQVRFLVPEMFGLKSILSYEHEKSNNKDEYESINKEKLERVTI